MSVNEEKLAEFHGRVFSDLSATYGGVMATLGNKLGLYKAMAGAGPLTSQEVADRAGCAERYVREWLSSQVAGEYIAYHPAGALFELPAEHAVVLADSGSPYFIPGAWDVPISMFLDEEKSIHAFKTGRGVPWGDHDGRLFCGVAAFFRNAYVGSLLAEWLPALDGIVDRLEAGIRVADVGCGHGHSTILMAQAFPKSRFWGFDVHAESIDEARRLAREAGVTDRVTFDVAGATDYPVAGYDFVCFFDCLHDLGDPVGAAAHAYESMAEGATLMLIEPFANDRLEDNINPVSRMYYAASTTLCCAHSLSEDVGLALGAQAGRTRLQEVMAKAGFLQFRTALESPFNYIFDVRK